MANLKEIVHFLDNYLDVSKVDDRSLNGLQVEGAQEIKKIALGVDACANMFEKANQTGARLIIVHHGIFWKDSDNRAVGLLAKRLKYLFEHNISLYAAHLPLDTHKAVGNSALIASAFGLKYVRPFGENSNGCATGVIGEFEKEMSVDEFISKTESFIGKVLRKNMFGKPRVKKIAIVSGGGANYLEVAQKQGADLFLTGETKHVADSCAEELKMNAVFAGHYETEKFGVIALGKALEKRFKGLKAEFINCPTGL